MLKDRKVNDNEPRKALPEQTAGGVLPLEAGDPGAWKQAQTGDRRAFTRFGRDSSGQAGGGAGRLAADCVCRLRFVNEMTGSIARPGIWSDFPMPLSWGETRRWSGWHRVAPEEEVKKQMVVKILGGLMLAVGAFFALRMLFDILVAAASIAMAAALLYFGWRLVSRER